MENSIPDNSFPDGEPYWRTEIPLRRPLDRSNLSPGILAHRAQVIDLILKPRSESGVGKESYLDAEVFMERVIKTAWIHHYLKKKTKPKDLCAEALHYGVWNDIFSKQQLEFPFEQQLEYWLSNGTAPAAEYLSYLQRRSAPKGTSTPASAPTQGTARDGFHTTSTQAPPARPTESRPQGRSARRNRKLPPFG